MVPPQRHTLCWTATVVPLPWRRIVLFALLGTVVTTVLVLGDVRRNGNNPLNLIQPGTQGPSADAIRRDFPDAPLPAGIGHDGQQFYAVARQPMHLSAVADDLDRPRYRLQRPLYPWLAWLLHPQGGGARLIDAMFLVGIASLIGLGVAAGALAASLDASPLWAFAAPILPGAYVSLRISTADALALALSVAAAAFVVRHRTAAGVVAAIAATLAKEVSLLTVIGVTIWRRDRASRLAAAMALATAAAWWLFLRFAVDASGPQVVEFVAPFSGFAKALPHWIEGEEQWGLVSVVATVFGVAALAVRGIRGLGWVVVLHVALVVILSEDAIGLATNAPRSTMPLMLFAALHLVTDRRCAAIASRTAASPGRWHLRPCRHRGSG